MVLHITFEDEGEPWVRTSTSALAARSCATRPSRGEVCTVEILRVKHATQQTLWPGSDNAHFLGASEHFHER